jgi:hypothetical protein
MSGTTARLDCIIRRIDALFADHKNGLITEGGLMDYLDSELKGFTRKDVCWSILKAQDYFHPMFCGDDRIALLYADVLFSGTTLEDVLKFSSQRKQELDNA